MSAVHLGVDLAGIDKEHLLRAFRPFLAPVQEPEGAGEGYGVEEVWPHCDHHIHNPLLDELFANLQLRTPGIGGGIGHDKAGPAVFFVQSAVEDLDPEVIGVVHSGQAEGEAGILLKPLFVHPVHIKGRIGHDEVKFAAGGGAVVQVFVVCIPLADVAAQAVHGQVHLGQAHCF